MKKIKIRLNKKYRTTLFFVILILTAITALSTVILNRAKSEKIDITGQARLDSIANRIGDSLYRSECLLDSVAMQAEQIIAQNANTAEKMLKDYFSSETIENIQSKSDGSCINAYAAYDEKLIINNFVPDNDFVLEERSWYIGAKKRMGAVNVSDPYTDATSGQMCYTISKLLSDGSTVIALDFNLTGVQSYIEEMNEDNSGTSLIVNDDGTIIGHSQAKYVGLNYREIDLYDELVNKTFMFYGDPFKYDTDNGQFIVYSAKTNYDWYLIVCVKRDGMDFFLSGKVLYTIIAIIIMSAAVIVLFLYLCRKQTAAENEIASKDEYLKNMVLEMRRPLSRIMNHASELDNSDNTDNGAKSEINDSAKELCRMLDDSIARSDAENSAKDIKDNSERNASRIQRMGKIVIVYFLVTVVLLTTGVFTYTFNDKTQSELSKVKMEKETQYYLDRVKDWALTNKTVLDVISESISAQSGFEEDYESAREYLDNIVSMHDDISVAYICNPEWERTVIMNNGWEPDAGWHVEERQWYIDTIASRNNFNVSAPYFDEQTGLYCTTLSKIVYDDKGDMIGVFAIDYYLDKLTDILGQSYTDRGYAFITDIDGNIINNPNNEFQMSSGRSVNAAEVCYRDALMKLDSEYVTIEDYDGKKKACYAMKEDITGFTVIAVKDLFDIESSAVYSSAFYVIMFLLCIVIVNIIFIIITSWQSAINAKLKEAVNNAVSAGKAKNDFLANMSHEIRTPINAVLGLNEMIIRESEDKQITDYAVNIQSAGRTLLSIINDILDFSKIESGKMEIVPIEYEISSLINDIINMIKLRAEKKNLSFIPEIDEKIPSVLFGDDVRLRQIITNLLTNAVKYTPEGTVRLKMSALKIENDILQLEVSVSDTGIGIKEEDMEKLFVSFQRLDQEKNRSIEGTGLGMAIVSTLLKMMNSELRVSSIYGSGSTFSFVIKQKIINSEPMGDYKARFKASAETVSDGASRTAPGARILVVDDNETNLIVAKSLLKRTLAQVDTVTSGAECIEILHKKIFDIVFLDHMMPEMDGIETLHKIKEDELAVGTVFIALTANAIHGAKQTYLEAGFDDYLSKPFSGHDIEKCLFSHISKDMIDLSESVGIIPSENAAVPADLIGTRLDIEKALEKLDGSTEAYFNAVGDFCESDRCNDLELDRNLKDMKSYRGNLKIARDNSEAAGLYELAEMADRLISAVDNSDESYIADNHAEFIKMYRKAVENLESTVNNQFPNI